MYNRTLWHFLLNLLILPISVFHLACYYYYYYLYSFFLYSFFRLMVLLQSLSFQFLLKFADSPIIVFAIPFEVYWFSYHCLFHSYWSLLILQSLSCHYYWSLLILQSLSCHYFWSFSRYTVFIKAFFERLDF